MTRIRHDKPIWQGVKSTSVCTNVAFCGRFQTQSADHCFGLNRATDHPLVAADAEFTNEFVKPAPGEGRRELLRDHLEGVPGDAGGGGASPAAQHGRGAMALPGRGEIGKAVW